MQRLFRQKPKITVVNERRRFLTTTGLALAGTSVLGGRLLNWQGFGEAAYAETEFAEFRAPDVVTETGGTKPVYLPAPRTVDPVAHSVADNLFWNDIMMEHALFFVMLMPGKELADEREKAQQFQRRFANHLQAIREKRITKQNYREMNRKTIDLVAPFHAFKVRMLERQLAGRVYTLVWPLFFDHTAREAKRFMTRLEMYSRGVVEFDRAEVADFWTHIMGEHAQFMAHLLDPQENALIRKASKTADVFLHDLQGSRVNIRALAQAGEEIIDFKTAAEKGIATGQIKSIIHPALADHVRREAVKYVDELKRTGA